MVKSTFDFNFPAPSETVKIWLYRGARDFGVEANRDLLRDIVDSLKAQGLSVTLYSNDQGLAIINSLPGFESIDVAERVAITLETHGYIVFRYVLELGQMLSDSSPIQSFVLV